VHSRTSCAQADADRHPRGGDLLQHLEIDLVRDLAAAPALGVRQPQQPDFAEQPELLAGELRCLFVLAR
jgi:hypothetical protein